MAEKNPFRNYSITPISQLSGNNTANTIVGVIIAKQEPRWLATCRGKSEGFVLGFTLRDSPMDTINVTCWGTKMGIKTLADQFHIGDVVAINNALVLLRENPDPYEIFKPSVTSPFHIKLDERHSMITLFSGDTNDYKLLLHIPVKADNDFHTLSDVLYNGQNLHGEFINLLVAVKKILEVKNILSKTGKNFKKCEIKVFDQTFPEFSFTIWNEENINIAQNWIPKQTVLFVSDAKITYDEFRKTMVASSTSRTVITINPDTQEAQALFHYAQSLQEMDDSNDSEVFFDINTIQTVYTVAEVQDKMKKENLFVGTEFSGIIFGYLTNVNIDSISPPCSMRCSVCRRRIIRNAEPCINPDCPVALGTERFVSKVEFDTFISVSDYTGSLQLCRLRGSVAENMFQCSVDHFLKLCEDEKTALKWQFLMEYCKIYFRVSMKSAVEEPTLTVLSCSLAEL